MEVDKRQREEKARKKNDRRKFRGPEWESQVKQTALLASPLYIEQA